MYRNVSTRKLSITLGVALACLVVAAALGCTKAEDAKPAKVVEQVATAEFLVKNMTCGSCDRGIIGTLSKLEGVTKVQADFKRGYASASYNPKKISSDELVAAINGLGFEARLRLPDDVDIPPAKKGVPEDKAGE